MAGSQETVAVCPTTSLESPRQISRKAGAESGGWQNTGSGRTHGVLHGNEEGLAAALGWFSIGLGLAEVATPGALAQLIGLRDRSEERLVLRAFGLREIATGIGILSRSRPAGWLWGRVAGDLLDLAMLGWAYASPRNEQAKLAAAAASVAGVTALDVFCAQRLTESSSAWRLLPKGGTVHTTKTITVNRSPEEVYRFWRDFQNLPRFMKHLESVEVAGQQSHWVARAPGGTTVEWDAEMTADEPNQRIAWRSLPGAAVENSGEVRFQPAPGNRGTVVRVEIQYHPPAGKLGTLAARLLGEEPSQQIQEDLRRFKRIMEVGELLTTEGQPAGRSSSTSWKYDRAVRGQ